MTSDTAKSMLIIAGCSEEENSDFSQLYGEDYNVVFADNAEAVIFSVSSNQYACAVIVDVCSGIIDCCGLIKAVRSNEINRDIQVIYQIPTTSL